MILRFLPMFLATVVLGGCQPTEIIPDLYPLTGTVTREGKPVTGGGLIFIPESGGWGGVTLDASVNPDGTFEARTWKTTGTSTMYKPGAKVGRYRVTFHPPSDGAKTGLQSELTLVVVVEAKDNFVALELPSKLPTGAGEPRDDANPPEILDPKKD